MRMCYKETMRWPEFSPISHKSRKYPPLAHNTLRGPQLDPWQKIIVATLDTQLLRQTIRPTFQTLLLLHKIIFQGVLFIISWGSRNISIVTKAEIPPFLCFLGDPTVGSSCSWPSDLCLDMRMCRVSIIIKYEGSIGFKLLHSSVINFFIVNSINST